MKKKLFAVLVCATMAVGILSSTAFADETEHQNHCVCGGTLSGHTHDENITWTGVSSLDEITGKGNYYLKNDVEYDGTFQPDDGVVLCLNGRNITCTAGTSSKAVAAVTVNKTFTLTDCRNVQGKVTHGTGKIGYGVMNNGTFNLYGGSVSGNTVNGYGAGVFNKSDAKFNMYGGSVSNNTATDYGQGGGVFNNGEFVMSGGTVSDNYSGGSGAGIVNLKGTFRMLGNASVRNNIINPENTSATGGGVQNYLGTFVMLGGEITGNKSNCGGGVSNGAMSDTYTGYTGYSSATFTMTGGKISGNEAAAVGGGLYNSTGDPEAKVTVNVSGNAVISDNKAKNGGGIGNSGKGTTVTVSENVQIKGNIAASATDLNAGDGGGIYNYGNSINHPVLNLNGVTISGNSARRGGGIYVSYCELTATDVTITDNTAEFGGGVHLGSTITTVLKGKTVISDNNAGKGKNLYFNSSIYKVSAAGLTDGTRIGVSAPYGVSYPMTVTADRVAKNYFFADEADTETLINSDGYVVLNEVKDKFTVKIILPDGNITARESGGALEQLTEQGGSIDSVILIADERYYFSSADRQNINENYSETGLWAEPVGDTDCSRIEISGHPKKNVILNITATAKKTQRKPAVEGVAPKSATENGHIFGTTPEMEYRVKGTLQWCDCGEITKSGESVEAGKTYEIRYKGTIIALPSDIEEVFVPAYSAPKVESPTPQNYTYDGQTYTGITLGNDYVVASGTNTATDAGTYSVYIKPADGKQWADGTVGTKVFRWEIRKAARSAPLGIKAVKPSSFGKNDGKITGVTDEMEYQLIGATSWIRCTGTEIANLWARKYNVRYRETANYKASDVFSVTVPDGDIPLYELTVFGGIGSGSYAADTTVTIRANAPEEGKAFDRWQIVFGNGIIENAESATTAVTMKAGAFAVKAVYKNDYRIIEGNGGSWTQNSDGTLAFRANGKFENFSGIKVDGNTVPADKYTSDSNVITLKNDFLTELSAGTHTLTVVYIDGECGAEFEVKTAHTHGYGTDWKYDKANHWHECACGDKSDTAAHDFVWKTDKDATKNSAGLKHEECSVCGATRSENTVIDKLNNASDTGDSSILILWVALAVVSGAIACLAVYAKKQKYFG